MSSEDKLNYNPPDRIENKNPTPSVVIPTNNATTATTSTATTNTNPNPNQANVPSSSSSATATEDVVSKYKRLLSLARSSLEANQAALASKDQQINELMAVIEEERNKKLSRQNHKDDNDPNQQFPRRILCRVDVNDVIWILLEFETQDEWKCFGDEESLHDYIKIVPGPPLLCPQKCLSTEESARLVDECKRKTDRIIEEFRRYKVRMEISLKQRDAETKSFINSAPAKSANGGLALASSLSLSSNLEKALSQGTMGEAVENMDELQRLKLHFHEQETKLRHAYEKIAKENELLKTKGAESVVAAQWRVRYENCLHDKEELAQKLALYTQLSTEVSGDGRTVEQVYMELQEEFKGLRKRLYELMHEYMTKEALGPNEIEEFLQSIGRVLQSYHIDHLDFDDSKLLTPMRPSTPRSAAIVAETHGSSNNTKGMAESKVQYVRQMIFQYLMCREPEVKQHIENALMTLFRFSDEEKELILLKEREENEDTFSSITNFLGSFTT